MITVKDILTEITRLRLERKWTEYQLSERSGIPQSTISGWYRKKQTSTMKSLEKICKGFDIPLSQFLAEGKDAICLTEEQKKLLDRWSTLTKKQKELFLELFETI